MKHFGRFLLPGLALFVTGWVVVACGPERLQDREFAYKHLATDSAFFSFGEAVGTVEEPALTEVSGLVASRRYPSVLWAHNDSGDGPYLYALDTNGRHLAKVALQADARDWEALALGSPDATGMSYLYVGDVGDNEAKRPYVTLFRVAEPNPRLPHATALPVDSLRFRYPDGPRDAEALLADPLDGSLWVVTKREDAVHVYRVPPFSGVDSIFVAEAAGTLPILAVTDGSIAPQSGSILLRTYDRLFFFRREGAEPLPVALARVPIRLPYFRGGAYEPQGEAITWDADGHDFFTLSEEYQQIPAELYRYRRRRP